VNPTRAQFRILLAKGYTPNQVGDMNQVELENEVEEAKAQGVTEETPIRGLIEEPDYAPPPTKDELNSKILELSERLEDVKWRYSQYKIISVLVLTCLIVGFFLYLSY
jgi:hypothetical protein